MIIFQGAKVNVICFWLIKPKFGKQGFSEFPSTVCGHLGEKRPKEQSKTLGDISFGPPGLLNMFLSAPNTIVLKSSSCLFLDWQWSFCLDALSSAWWERGYHLCDQQKECYDWVTILPWPKDVALQAFRNDPGLRVSLSSETHLWKVRLNSTIWLTQFYADWKQIIYSRSLREGLKFSTKPLQVEEGPGSHCYNSCGFPSISPRNNCVFSESLKLYSLSTYTVSDKFLNEYHRPNRWRITQTQIRNTRELVKCPGECLFPAHFLCWPPVLFLVTSSTHWLQMPSCWWHSNLHPNPDFYPIPQNSKLTFTAVYIFTVTPQPFLFKEVQDRNSIFPTYIPSCSFSRIPHVSK